MIQVILLGGGGHARVLVDILNQQSEYFEIKGYLAPEESQLSSLGICWLLGKRAVQAYRIDQGVEQ